MDEATTRVTVDKQVPGYWRVTLNHPPINTVDDLMYDEIFDLVQAIDAEPGLKVVTFESADPDYFLAHYGVGESQSRFGAPRWRDAAIQLAHSNVLSIAVIRGRARGGGSEFALGCDVRFASRERAIFGQPEVGFGLIPGGGATERLPLLVGRSRAIEIVLGGDDFDADTAEKYGWINRAIPESGARRLRQPIRQARAVVRRSCAGDRQTTAQSDIPARPRSSTGYGGRVRRNPGFAGRCGAHGQGAGARPQYGESVRTRPRPRHRRTVGMSDAKPPEGRRT